MKWHLISVYSFSFPKEKWRNPDRKWRNVPLRVSPAGLCWRPRAAVEKLAPQQMSRLGQQEVARSAHRAAQEDQERQMTTALEKSRPVKWNVKCRPATLHADGLRVEPKRDAPISFLLDFCIKVSIVSETRTTENASRNPDVGLTKSHYRVWARFCRRTGSAKTLGWG